MLLPPSDGCFLLIFFQFIQNLYVNYLSRQNFHGKRAWAANVQKD